MEWMKIFVTDVECSYEIIFCPHGYFPNIYLFFSEIISEVF